MCAEEVISMNREFRGKLWVAGFGGVEYTGL